MRGAPAVRQPSSGTGRGIVGRSNRRPACGCWSRAGRSSPGARPSGAGCCSALPRGRRRRGPGLGDLALLVLLRVRLPRPRQLGDRRHPAGLLPGLRPADGRADDRRVPGGPPLPAGAPDPDRHRLAGRRAGPDAERLSGQLLGLPRRRAARGHWVWLRLPPQGQLHAARVVAVAGQELEWTGPRWRVDGQVSRLLAPLRNSAWPPALPVQGPARPGPGRARRKTAASPLRPARSSWSPRTRSSAAPGPSTIPSGTAACCEPA